MMRAKDEVRFWIDETMNLPDHWWWQRTAPPMSYEYLGVKIVEAPAPIATGLNRAKMRVIRDIFTRAERQQEAFDRDPFVIMPDDTALLPAGPPILQDIFAPPPLSAVRSDQLSRLWSRKP